MVLSQEGEDQLNRKHLDLCTKLNLDHETITASWDNFRSINKNFVLEGDSMHWLGCSVFVACRSKETPTVGSGVIKGNCINLTSLLRHSNLSFAQFFCNINKWAEMSHLPEEFHNKISHLKDNFGVAYNTFKEYYPIFSKIFIPPSPQELDQTKQHRHRKQRPVPCNTSKVFEFIWNLFITVKSEDAQYSTELIKSYHLLYACIDLAYQNAVLDERRDLLNPQFEGLPPDWNDASFVTPTEAPCIINSLCKCPSMLTEAMHTKKYVLRKMITNLIKNKTLVADQTNLTGLFSEYFEINFKNVTNAYEAQLLHRGDFDERIFLAEYRRQLLEQQSSLAGVRASPFCDLRETGTLESPRNNSGITTPGGCDTPLTGRGFLGPRDADVSPTIDRITTQKISRLHSMLNNRSPAPSESLVQLFESCQKDPLNKINNILTILGDKFVFTYSLNNPQGGEEAKNRLQIGITLFYKFIENILQNEKNIRKDISALVEKDLFYQCMFTCCLEIVLFSYSSSKHFPWILDALEIEPFHFVKVIELIVRSKDQLSREMIKHLNKIEETVIESLAWRSSSQLWDIIMRSGQSIPKYEDTALPGHLLYNEQTSNNKSRNSEPSSDVQSPGPSATDRFQSPVTNATTVNRQLFPAVQPGQSVLQKHTHINKDGNKKLIPLVEAEKQPQQQQNSSESAPTLPKRTGSLSIIFRKFYNLAGVRMEHLCTKLGLTDMELKQKIWTVFEDSVRNTDLIKDRHLDQLLMCAVYVICKVSGSALQFQDIMKFYREQPQSVSDVYRDVLLTREKAEPDGPVIPATRSNLIHFYNSIYVDVMKKFAVKFRNSVQTSGLLLSPLPAIKRDLVSPSIQVGGNVFVKPLESPSAASSGTSFNYYFSRSPSKDLKDINKLVNSTSVTGKRLLVEGDMDIPASKRISNRKLQSLVEERRSQNSE